MFPLLVALLALLALPCAAQNWRSCGCAWRSHASTQWAASGSPAWLSPGSVHWLGGGGYNVQLAWTASSTAGVAYRVFRGPWSVGPWTEIGDTAALTFTDVGPPAGTWWYTVAAVAGAGAGALSPDAPPQEAVVP